MTPSSNMTPSTHIQFHKTCRTISVYSFYKASLYQDFRYLIKGYDEDIDKSEYSEYRADMKLKKLMEDILEEYSVLIRDKKSLRLRKMEWELIYLVGQHQLILKVLKIFTDSKINEVLEILNDLEIPFDINKPIGKQIDSAIMFSKRLKNKINIKRINFKRLSGVKDGDNEKQTDPDDVINSLDKTALSLETNLELGYQLDIKKTNMERWENLIEMNRKRATRSK